MQLSFTIVILTCSLAVIASASIHLDDRCPYTQPNQGPASLQPSAADIAAINWTQIIPEEELKLRQCCAKAYRWANANHMNSRWCGYCLGFCNAAWTAAGYSKDYLSAGSAAAAVPIAQAHTKYWVPWSSNTNPPKGALVLFRKCNYPKNVNGHACLSNGNGACLSDCVSSPQSFAWYRNSYCGANPSGWIIPCHTC